MPTTQDLTQPEHVGAVSLSRNHPAVENFTRFSPLISLHVSMMSWEAAREQRRGEAAEDWAHRVGCLHIPMCPLLLLSLVSRASDKGCTNTAKGKILQALAFYLPSHLHSFGFC